MPGLHSSAIPRSESDPTGHEANTDTAGSEPSEITTRGVASAGEKDKAGYRIKVMLRSWGLS
jgi:hypothetical protein